MNPEVFKANVQGIARTNRYDIRIMPKNAELNSLFNANPIYRYLCKEVSLPGKEIRVSDIQYFGGSRNIATNVDYDPLSIVFYSDAKLELRKNFIKWISDYILNLSTWTVGFYQDYICEIEIDVLNGENQVIQTIRVEEAFPKSVSETTLSWENSDTPFEFTVSFQYFDWIPIK